MVIFLSPGISFLYEYQVAYRQQDEASSAVYSAIYTAIPAFADDAKPYLLLITDLDADSELALHPQDYNFPRIFAMHYDIQEFRADAVLYNIDASLTSQRIQLTDEGIISPLRTDEVIAYDRVVIAQYDSQTGQATILDTLPDDVLATGNFNGQPAMPIVTHHDLLE